MKKFYNLMALVIFISCTELINDKLAAACIEISGAEAVSQDPKKAQKEAILLSAAKLGNLQTVKRLIESGVSVNCEDEKANTPIMLASDNNKPEVVKFLLEHDASLSQLFRIIDSHKLQSPNKHENPIISQIINEFIQTELGKISYKKAIAEKLLIECVFENDSKRLDLFLKGNQSYIDQKFFKNRKTLLMISACLGANEIVKILLTQGANPNLIDEYRQTALTSASGKGYSEIVRLLLDKGADPNIQDILETTPLIIAIDKAHTDIAKMLIEANSILDLQNNYKLTALMVATERGNKETVKILLEKGANPNLQNDHNNTALMLAIDKGYHEISEMLIEKGADPNLINNEGHTALTIAVDHENNEAVKMLLANKANPNTQNKNGITVLIAASLFDHIDIVQTLLNGGADPKIKELYSGLGLTALDVALNNNNFYLANILDPDFPIEDLFIKAIKAQKYKDVEYFIKKNPALINYKEKKYSATALMGACEIGNKEISELLINNGADILAQTRSGWTALKIAKQNNFPEIVTLLQEKIDSLEQKATKFADDLLVEEAKLKPSKPADEAGAGIVGCMISRSWSCDSEIQDLEDSDEQFLKRFLILEKEKKSKSSKKSSHKQRPKKCTNISKCQIHNRIERWFNDPDSVLETEYSHIQETAYDNIIFHHNFAQVIDNIAQRFSICDYDKLNHETNRALCYVIKDGKKMVPRVIEYGINNTRTREDNKPILVHRYMNKIAKHTGIEKLFRTLHDDVKPSNILKTKPLSEPCVDGSYIMREETDFIEIHDPKNNATIFICRPI